MSDYKDKMEGVATKARGPRVESGTDAKSLPDIFKDAQEKFGAALNSAGSSGKNVKVALDKASYGIMKSLQEGGKGLDAAIKIGVADVVKSASGLGKALGPAIGALVVAVLEVIHKGNRLWADMFSGGIEGSMRALNKVMIEAVGGQKSPLGKALGGFLDNVISSMMFKFEDGLKYREGQIAAEAQTGTGSKEGIKFAAESTKHWWALGRQEGAAWTKAFSSEGITDTAVFDKMLGVGKQLGMDAGTAAAALGQYVSFGNSAADATEKIEQNFRKLQAAAQGTTIPVKLLEKGVRDAATAARFMNVDVATVGNTMANLVKESANMSKFGVDMRMHSGAIAKDLAGGGSKMSDAMHMYFGSKGGKEDTGMAGWAKSRFGAGTDVKATAGGGFEMGAGAADSKNMMQQRIDMQKQAMLQASEGGGTPEEKLFMQIKAAKDMFGLSEEAAVALATTDQENLKKLTDSPAMAAEFKSTNQILGETQTMAAKSEQLQRLLVSIQMNALQEALKAPTYFANLAKSFSGDKKGEEELKKMSGANISGFATQLQQIAPILRSVDPETFNLVGAAVKNAADSLDQSSDEAVAAQKSIKNTFGGASFAAVTEPKKGAALGGPVSANEPIYVGEKGKEIFTPNTSGNIIPNDKLAGIGGSNASSPTVNINISGVTKDQIMNQVIDAVRNNFS